MQVICRFRPTREPNAMKWFEINEEKVSGYLRWRRGLGNLCDMILLRLSNHY